MKEAVPPAFSVLCLGNFDGVHIGHRALIKETLEQKGALSSSFEGLASGAWLFETPPSHFLSEKSILQLTTTEEKLAHFAALGLDYAFLADFSALRDYEPFDFIENILKQKCHCVYTVCGFDFRFAKNAVGDAETLVRLMGGMGTVLNCVSLDGETVSSSTIRSLLTEGKIEEANRMLGYPFPLFAKVLHGKALGHTIGIPTVNQHFKEGAIRPLHGVYVSRVWIDDSTFPAVSNIGCRPTFDDGETINCETHIIGYEGDLYGKPLKVEFLKRLRDEIAFPSLQALKEQLHTDVANATDYFNHKRRQI